MKAVGITCGIGSMLVGARQAGFSIVGNVEWRKYYHATDPDGRNTFRENFPDADFRENLDHMSQSDIEKFFGADLALGHPECGNFSTLSAPNLKMGHDHRMDPADIPLFVDLVAKLKPRFFVMDDLPKSLVPFPMEEYHKRLPDYDLFPEWIHNWGYGNVQKGRKRFFMIGSRKEERWAFRPGEFEHRDTVRDCLDDLPLQPPVRGNFPNHEPHADYERSTLFISDGMKEAILAGREPTEEDLLRGGRRHASWTEVAEIVGAMPEGKTIPYIASDGRHTKLKIGFFRPRWNGHSYVLTGGPNSSLHPLRCSPYTIRERARIQGFPDDFVFYGSKLNPDGTFNILKNVHMVKQTGKAMPVQFCRYVSKQIAAHCKGETFESSGERVLAPRAEISQAKQWYCENIGYSDQARACSNCWLYRSCSIRMRKYQIGEPAVGQRDAFDPGITPVPVPRGEPKARIEAKDRPVPVPKEPVPVRDVPTRDYTFGG